MKKLICIVAGAALLGACEQKTEVVAPPANTPAPLSPEEAARMGERPKKSKSDSGASLSTAMTPAESGDKKIESAPAAAATATFDAALKLDSAAAAGTPAP